MASRSLNKVTLIGNLTRDPELKYTPSGAAVCTIGIATNRSWVTADGSTREDTQFHRLVAWNKLAELTAKLLTKGKKVFMEGRLSYRSYTGKDGVQRSITEIILDDFIVFGSSRPVSGEEAREEESPAPATSATERVASEETVAPEPEPSIKKSPPKKAHQEESVDPDDIPF